MPISDTEHSYIFITINVLDWAASTVYLCMLVSAYVFLSHELFGLSEIYHEQFPQNKTDTQHIACKPGANVPIMSLKSHNRPCYNKNQFL